MCLKPVLQDINTELLTLVWRCLRKVEDSHTAIILGRKMYCGMGLVLLTLHRPSREALVKLLPCCTLGIISTVPETDRDRHCGCYFYF